MKDSSAIKKIINMDDIKKGMDYYLENEVVAARKENNNTSNNMMYM